MTPHSAAALAAFNLVCTGLETTGSGEKSRPTQAQFSEVYRVDLKQHRWCRDTCTETQELGSLTETEITFGKQPNESKPVSASMAKVNRESGKYTSLVYIGGYVILRQGECHRASFTGFPARKF